MLHKVPLQAIPNKIKLYSINQLNSYLKPLQFLNSRIQIQQNLHSKRIIIIKTKCNNINNNFNINLRTFKIHSQKTETHYHIFHKMNLKIHSSSYKHHKMLLISNFNNNNNFNSLLDSFKDNLTSMITNTSNNL